MTASLSPHGAATARTGLPARGAPSGHVQTTGQQRSKDGLLQLLIQRELLMADARHLKNNRRSKAASRCAAELRRVTREIMKIEVRNACVSHSSRKAVFKEAAQVFAQDRQGVRPRRERSS